MKNQNANKHLLALTEESVIFASIIKWIFLATVIGVLVGGMTTVFLKILEYSINSASKFNNLHYFLPLSFFISALVTHYVSPDSEGHGTEKVIEAVHKKHGEIRARVVPIKLFTTILTIATGGSAGKEGPCAQIGAGLASTFANIFKFDKVDRKKMVICGISAGFASVFGTPIAGAIFGVEVLVVGSILYEVLLPSFIAGMVSYQVSAALGIHYHASLINFIPDFTAPFFIKIVLAGVFFGLCSFLFIELMKFGEKLSKSIKIWHPLKGLIGGGLLILLTMFFSKEYLGLGLKTIENGLNGEQIIWYAFILKAIFTTITLSFGGSGGVVTPIFYIGTTSGLLFASIFGLDPAMFAGIGLVSLLAGAANTPLAACIMAVELFGSTVAPYATIACVVSFLMTGYRSVYPSQVLGINKSPSIQVKTGYNIEKSETHFEYKTRKMMAKGKKVSKKVQKIIKRFHLF